MASEMVYRLSLVANGEILPVPTAEQATQIRTAGERAASTSRRTEPMPGTFEMRPFAAVLP